jgi:hypothetical protein
MGGGLLLCFLISIATATRRINRIENRKNPTRLFLFAAAFFCPDFVRLFRERRAGGVYSWEGWGWLIFCTFIQGSPLL